MVSYYPNDERLLVVRRVNCFYLKSFPVPVLFCFSESRVVGWFRFSARSVFSPIMPSIHDLVKHKLLQDLIPEDIRAGFVFLSVTESYNQDCGVGVKGFDRALFSIARIDSLRANWERIELHVPNLGDTDAGKR